MNTKVLTVWAIITFITFSWCCIYLGLKHDRLEERVKLHEQAIELLVEGQEMLHKELQSND